MDAKSRKIVNFLSKNQDEYDSADISMALKMNDIFVEKALEILEKYGTVNCRRDDNGNAYWSVPSRMGRGRRGSGSDFDDDRYTGRKASGGSGSIAGYIVTAAISVIISAVLSLTLTAGAAGSKLREASERLETLEASIGNRVSTLERKIEELEQKVDSLSRPPAQQRRR